MVGYNEKPPTWLCDDCRDQWIRAQLILKLQKQAHEETLAMLAAMEKAHEATKNSKLRFGSNQEQEECYSCNGTGDTHEADYSRSCPRCHGSGLESKRKNRRMIGKSTLSDTRWPDRAHQKIHYEDKNCRQLECGVHGCQYEY